MQPPKSAFLDPLLLQVYPTSPRLQVTALTKCLPFFHICPHHNEHFFLYKKNRRITNIIVHFFSTLASVGACILHMPKLSKTPKKYD